MLYAMPEASDRTSSTKFIFPKMQPIIEDSTAKTDKNIPQFTAHLLYLIPKLLSLMLQQ
jgi:hypothetical protein